MIMLDYPVTCYIPVAHVIYMLYMLYDTCDMLYHPVLYGNEMA